MLLRRAGHRRRHQYQQARVDQNVGVNRPLENAGAAGLGLDTVRDDAVEAPGYGEVAVRADGEVGDVCSCTARTSAAETSGDPVASANEWCSCVTTQRPASLRRPMVR